MYDYSNIFEEDEDDELYFDAQEMKEKEYAKQEVNGFYTMDNEYGGIYSKNVYVFRASEKSGYAMLPLDQRCILSFISVAAQIH